MVMLPPDNRSLCVVNENVVTDAEVVPEMQSKLFIIMLTFCTWPCAIARLVALEFKKSTEVFTLSPALFDADAEPVVNSPAANVML